MLSYIISVKKVEDKYFHTAITNKGYAIIKSVKELNPGSWLEVSGKTKRIDSDTFEIEADKIQLATNPNKKEAREIEKFVSDSSKLVDSETFLKNEEMKMLLLAIEEVAEYIKKACVLKRPIIIRYDNDQDGLSGAIALYNALKNYYNVKFVTQQFPYYSRLNFEDDKRYIDSLEAKHLSPVLVTVDFGYNPESEEGYRLAKDNGFSIVVIDHHPPQKPEIKDLLDSILSPWIFDIENPSSYTAGMLASEVAKKISHIDKRLTEKLIRISLTADRSKLYKPDKTDLKNAEAVGYFIGTSAYENNIVQYAKAVEDEEMLDFAYAQSQEKIQNFIEKAVKTTKSKTVNGITFFLVNVTRHIKKGSYPNKGLAANIMADLLGDKKYPVITIVYTGRNISFRANKLALDQGLDISKAILQLKKEMMEGIESGGGHKAAAALRVKPGYLNDALDKIIHYIAEQKEDN